MITWIVLGVVVLLLLWLVVIYNGLVRLKHGVGKAWANIDVLLRQRHEELPKLVETCKQYMQHERATLERVIAARNAVASARERHDMQALGQAESGLRAGLGKLFALALARARWSEVVAIGDETLELRLREAGAREGAFTYDGDSESFTTYLDLEGSPFNARFETRANGRLAVASLPPGRYRLGAKLAQAFGGAHYAPKFSGMSSVGCGASEAACRMRSAAGCGPR